MAKPFSKAIDKVIFQSHMATVSRIYTSAIDHTRGETSASYSHNLEAPTTKEWWSNSWNVIFSHDGFVCAVVECNGQFKTYTATAAHVAVRFPYWNRSGLVWVLLGYVSSFAGYHLRCLFLRLFFFFSWKTSIASYIFLLINYTESFNIFLFVRRITLLCRILT